MSDVTFALLFLFVIFDLVVLLTISPTAFAYGLFAVVFAFLIGAGVNDR